MSDVTLWVGGYPATEIAAHTPPTWETLADGGTGEIKWEFALTPRSQHPALRPGSLVVVKVGAFPVARGAMVDPDRTTWQCVARGLQYDNYLALDNTGSATRQLSSAIQEAINRGWRVRNPNGVGVGSPVPGDSTEPQLVSSLLTEAAVGKRWGIDPQGNVYMRTDPSLYWWQASPDAAVLGTTDEGAATRLAGRYFDGTNNVTVIWPPLGEGEQFGNEESVDLTDRGTLTEAQAIEILDASLAEMGAIKFTNGVTLARDQISTRGGSAAFLPGITAGSVIRAHGLLATRRGLQTPVLDFVIGKTRHTAGEDTIYIEPTALAPRTAVAVWTKNSARATNSNVRR